MKKFRDIYQKYMLRPIIYMTAYRTLLAVIILLAIRQFMPSAPSVMMIATFLAAVFALLAYLVFLRMDGIRIPRMKYYRPKKKRDPLRNFGDMADHMDEEPGVTFEELEDDEKNLCSLLANLINLALFLVISFIA